MPLAIRVQFLAGYSGREWPPSPARLFKALVSSARAGWASAKRDAIDDALRVLEQQGWTADTNLPEIVAPHAKLRPSRQRRFVPNNSRSWPTERRLNPEPGIDLEPEPVVGWDIDVPSTVWYWWPNVEVAHLEVLRDVARRVVSVGRGEDLAVLDAIDVKPPAEAVHWVPAPGGAWLEVPEVGCLAVCDATFGRDLDSFRLPAAGVRAVGYASASRASPTAVPTFVLALWRDGKRVSWDARLLRQIIGPVRHLLDEIRAEVVDSLARGPADRAAIEALARRVLVGHDESDKPIAEPHLAILPLPSVLGAYPDGRVRRLALADFGDSGDSTRRAIVEMAQVLLHHRELMDNEQGTGIFLGMEPDGQWLQTITKPSRTWATVTPMVQVAKELTAAEWRRLLGARRIAEDDPVAVVRLEARLRARRLELVERSVRQAIAGQDSRIVSVELATGGPIAGVHVAAQYRTRGYLSATPKLHLRVTFDRPIAGPLAIGRGRHVGFGVMWPVQEHE